MSKKLIQIIDQRLLIAQKGSKSAKIKLYKPSLPIILATIVLLVPIECLPQSPMVHRIEVRDGGLRIMYLKLGSDQSLVGDWAKGLKVGLEKIKDTW